MFRLAPLQISSNAHKRPAPVGVQGRSSQSGRATGGFEQPPDRLAGCEALAGSDNAQYNAMANGFKLYRVVEPGPNNYVIYYWFLDPVVSGGNYAVAKVLLDEMPDEGQALYEAYSGALEGGGQQAINMSLVMDF